jgi:hypothetical protein
MPPNTGSSVSSQLEKENMLVTVAVSSSRAPHGHKSCKKKEANLNMAVKSVAELTSH